MLEKFNGHRILLLQGPLGPFFQRLAQELRSHGAEVIRMHFCGGDAWFGGGGDRSIAYRGPLYNWPDRLKKIIREEKIDDIFLLGDLRPYHRVVRDAIKGFSTKLYVFEEGYLRPDYITLEPDGVNGNSRMSRYPDFYLKQQWPPLPEPLTVGATFGISARYTITYYCATFLAGLRYRHYVHHRDTGPLWHGFRWVRGLFRKYYYQFKEKKLLPTLTDKWSKRFFLFPLQVHNDYQFYHADFPDIETCINEVISSFAKHARRNQLLVIKHHPADRPYRDYSALIERLAIAADLRDRILYVHDLHLPTLLKHARGTVVMNSTTGLQSIHHGTPVMVLGRAIYNIEGLTARGTLDKFWRHPPEVNAALYRAFRCWLVHNNQFNGNFYRRIKGLPNPTGVLWDAAPLPAEAPAPAVSPTPSSPPLPSA